MPWMIVSIVLLMLTISFQPVPAGGEKCPGQGECSECHWDQLTGSHGDLSCTDCHSRGPGFLRDPASVSDQAGGCLTCHSEYAGFLQGQMVTRQTEKETVKDIFDQVDPQFFDNNCQSCHISSCLDCHGQDGHRIGPPDRGTCHNCHKGYFVGADYYGRAPREDALRYQRGPEKDNEHYLKMAPDVHERAGMSCGDCHTMTSLSGDESAKGCRDCHQPDPRVIDHGIEAHLENMECYACHSAWAPQEYGTFYIRVDEDSEIENYFKVKEHGGKNYIKSSYLKRQDEPPLGLNSRGKISPVRPQFIFYYSDLRQKKETGVENLLLAPRWRAFFPHTIQRGTVMCDGCHDKPSRFLLQPKEDRLLDLERDGMGLSSFWSREGQEVANGSFINPERFKDLNRKTPAYNRPYVKKWKQLIESVEDSSKK